MKEIWKEIDNYEQCYEVSNIGNIRSMDRIVRNNKGIFLKKGRILKAIPNSQGYLRVDLKVNDSKKQFVHRLVANAFIPNPNNKPFINHKDCNPLNNKANNLEWCTQKENVDYMIKLGRNKRTKEWINKLNNSLSKYRKSVIGISKNNDKKVECNSIQETKKYGFRPGDVCKCCRGERKSAGGYNWRYKNG